MLESGVKSGSFMELEGEVGGTSCRSRNQNDRSGGTYTFTVFEDPNPLRRNGMVVRLKSPPSSPSASSSSDAPPSLPSPNA
jgi:hypothetical protein